MKVRLDREEYWPWYSISDDSDTYLLEVELPDDFMRRYRRVMKQMETLQNEMDEAYERARRPQARDNPPLPAATFAADDDMPFTITKKGGGVDA